MSAPADRRPCEFCRGSGNDTEHKYSDGTPSACVYCLGYGFILSAKPVQESHDSRRITLEITEDEAELLLSALRLKLDEAEWQQSQGNELATGVLTRTNQLYDKIKEAK